MAGEKNGDGGVERTMIDGEVDIEKEGGVGPNVCMDFFVLTEYLVMSRLS